jgi:hypothetical protein
MCFSFKAFISYSHAADGKLAPAIQRGLHQFARPWYRKRALRVFRDDTNLSLSPGLWSTIEKALGESEFFVLLASPESAASKWVWREVDFWLEHRSPDTLLIVLTDGAVGWNPAAGDYDWQQTTALPSNLAGKFREEPHHLDLRAARTALDLSLNNPAFRDKIADLSVYLRGLSKDEVIGEDVRQHRRTKRVAWSVGIALFALAVSLGVAFWLAKIARDEERVQRGLAEQRLRVATARELAGRARDQFGDAQLSLLVALHAAYETYVRDGTVTADAQEALQWALQWLGGDPEFARDWMPASGDRVLSPDGRRLVMAGNPLTVFATGISEANGRREPSLKPLYGIRGHAGETVIASFSPDGRTIAAGGTDGVTTLLDSVAGHELTRLRGHCGRVLALAFSEDGLLLATGGADGTTRIWSVALNRLEHAISTRDGAVRSVALASKGMRLATGGDSGAKIWDIGSGRLLRSIPHNGVVTRVAFRPDASQVAVAGGIIANIWDTTSGRLISGLPGHVAGVNAAAFRPPLGKDVATASGDGTVRLWDVDSGKVLLSLWVGVGEPMMDVRFSRDGNYLLTTGEQNLRLYPLAVEDLLRVAHGFVTRSLTAEECRKYLRRTPCPALPSSPTVQQRTSPASNR